MIQRNIFICNVADVNDFIHDYNIDEIQNVNRKVNRE